VVADDPYNVMNSIKSIETGFNNLMWENLNENKGMN
jgi:hypothetical protein